MEPGPVCRGGPSQGQAAPGPRGAAASRERGSYPAGVGRRPCRGRGLGAPSSQAPSRPRNQQDTCGPSPSGCALVATGPALLLATPARPDKEIRQSRMPTNLTARMKENSLNAENYQN